MNEKMEKEREDSLALFKEMEPWLMKLHLGETIVISNGKYIIDKDWSNAVKRASKRFSGDAHKLVRTITKYEDGELVPTPEKCTNPSVMLGNILPDLDAFENQIRRTQPNEIREVALHWIADWHGVLILGEQLEKIRIEEAFANAKSSR